MAVSRILNAITTIGFQLGVGYFFRNYESLLLGALLGYFANCIAMIAGIDSVFRKKMFQFSRNHLTMVARKFQVFPRTNLLQAAVDMLQINGPVYIIRVLFSPALLGLFSFAFRLVQAPMNFVGSALAQVFYREAQEDFLQNKILRHRVRRIILISTGAGIPVMGVLIFAGAPLFAFVFGEQWRGAGIIAGILSPLMLTDFIRASLSQIPIIMGWQKKYLSVSSLSVLFIAASFLPALFFKTEFNYLLLVMSVSLSLLYSGLIGWVYFESGKSRQQL